MNLRTWIIDDLGSLGSKLHRGILDVIPTERRAERVDGGGIAPTYILWHLARHHDVAVNGVLRGVDAVVDGWTDRLGVDTDLWRGLAEGEDQDLVDELDPEAVGGYALAVLEASASWLGVADLAPLDGVPDSVAALQALGAPEDRFDWLYRMWDGQPASWYLKWSAVGHGFNHLGELTAIRNRMGLSPF